MVARPIAQNIGQITFGKGHSICLGPYAQNTALLDNGFLELDNNTAERAMKPVARPFDMPWAVCPKHGPTSTTAEQILELDNNTAERAMIHSPSP